MFVYVYGVTKGGGNRDFVRIGIGKHKVYTIGYRGVAALVSNTPKMVCEPTIENAQTHENVIREVMKNRPVIPMGFGIVARDEDNIVEILKRGYVNFKNVLGRIDRKVQIDAKVSWNLEKLFIDVLNENAEIRRLRDEVVKKPEEQSLNERIELGRMVHSAMEKKKENYKKEILSTFGSLSGEPPAENKLTSDRMIMNLSFLVNKNMENAFYSKVDELEGKHDGRLEILAVGPLPPYNFTKMEIRRIDFKSVDAARKILGLGEEATLAELEAAHRNLAYKYHPDRNPDPSAEEQFKKIEKSYNLLITYCKHSSSSPCSFRKPDVKRTIMIVERG